MLARLRDARPARRHARGHHRRPRPDGRGALLRPERPDGGDTNWYTGNSFNDGRRSARPSPALQPLIDTGQRRVLLPVDGDRDRGCTDTSPAKVRRGGAGDADAARRDRDLYAGGHRYRLDSTRTSTPMTELPRWWLRHGQELIDTMAATTAPTSSGCSPTARATASTATTAARRRRCSGSRWCSGPRA